jgi:L-amino acid N-acyltransferase YncA
MASAAIPSAFERRKGVWTFIWPYVAENPGHVLGDDMYAAYQAMHITDHVVANPQFIYMRPTPVARKYMQLMNATLHTEAQALGKRKVCFQ